MGQCDKCKWYQQDKKSKTNWNYACRYKKPGVLGSPDDKYYNQDFERCMKWEPINERSK